MHADSWIQTIITIGGLIVSMIVFYFKSETVLRKEILASEERLRTGMDGIKHEVGKLSTRVAVIEALDGRHGGTPSSAE